MAGILANSASVSMLVGSPDANQDGYLSGEQITLTVTPGASSVQWSAAKPTSSLDSSELSADTGHSVTFTPDVGGYYVFVALVDGTTTYVLRIAVTEVAAVVPYEALRMIPTDSDTVPTPVMGGAVHESIDGTGLVVKRPGPALKHLEPQALTPASASDAAGAEGEIAYDNAFLYVKNASGWRRLSLAWADESSAFLAQAVWHIKDTGDNAADGLTEGTALASFAELNRRWNGGTIRQHTIVYVDSDMAENPFPNVRIGIGGSLRYIFKELQTLLTGTLATYTETTGMGGTAGEPRITVAGVTDWATAGPGGTSLLGYQMKITSGTGVNASMMIVSKLSTDPATAQCTLPDQLTGGVAEDSATPAFPGTLSPASGSGFAVVRRASIPSFDPSRLRWEAQPTPSTPVFMLIGARMTAAHMAAWIAEGPAGPYYYRCFITGILQLTIACGNGLQMANVIVQGTTSGLFVRTGTLNIARSACRLTTGGNALFAGTNSWIFCSNRVFVVGGRVYCSDAATIQGSALGVYDNTTLAGELDQAAVRVQPGGLFGPSGSGGTTWLTYGKTAVGKTVWVLPGGTYVFRRGEPPTVPGAVAGQDYLLGKAGGTVKAWAALPADGEETLFARLIAGQ